MNLADLKALCSRATPGPWHSWNAYPCAGGSHPKDDRCVHVARVGPADVSRGIVADSGRRDLNGTRDDFQFVCAARTWLPVLIAVAEVAKPALETARECLLAWNAMGMSPEQAAEITRLYEQSPEIQQIDAALAALRRVEEGR